MKRNAFALLGSALAVCALTACAPAVPDSGAGVGFDNYSDHSGYRSQRDAVLDGDTLPTRPVQASPSNPAPATVTTSALPEDDADGAAPTVALDHPGISDENDFAAVSNRQSIESDAERLRAQREAREVIEPTALPTRATAGPNIVEYAISTQNPVGQKIYSRSVLSTQNKFLRNCAKYSSSDLAQEDFLRSGGPERDRMGLDPDGDGFACTWDPTPFRRISLRNG